MTRRTIDRTAVRSYLLMQGRISSSLDVNGTVIGVEVVRNSGSMMVNRWTAVLR